MGHNVFLDMSHKNPSWTKSRFPSIYQYLKQRYNLDLSTDLLPITPAAHYTCGGVNTDLHGRTNIQNLYCAGEAARTGLHGGNRLASTSLLEGLVFGASVADFVGLHSNDADISRVVSSFSSSPQKLSSSLHQSNSKEASNLLSTLRQTMWKYVGVERTLHGTKQAMKIISEIK